MKTHSQSTRLLTAVKADILSQWKNGFYTIYGVLLVLYMIILAQLPRQAANIALPILVYTDPSVLGLFFIGGIVMLEKQQGVLSLLYITPLRIKEYIISKLSTLTLIALLVSLSLSLLSYGGHAGYGFLIVGVILTSLFYTIIGLMVATQTLTVNEFFIEIIPWMLGLIIPCFALAFRSSLPNWLNILLNIIPSIAGLQWVMAAYHPVPWYELMIGAISLMITIIVLYRKSLRMFDRYIAATGE